MTLTEKVARTLAGMRVIQNMAIEGRERDQDFINRATDHSWPDYADTANAVIATVAKFLANGDCRD